MNELGYMGRRQMEDYRRAVALFDGSKVSHSPLCRRQVLGRVPLFAAAALGSSDILVDPRARRCPSCFSRDAISV